MYPGVNMYPLHKDSKAKYEIKLIFQISILVEYGMCAHERKDS